MIMFKTSLLLATLASAQAFDLGTLRGFDGEPDAPVEQFACAMAGSGGQDACDVSLVCEEYEKLVQLMNADTHHRFLGDYWR
jgi:hypothetical protein